MDKLKFVKTEENRWECVSRHGNYKTCIERRGWFYYASCYAIIGEKGVLKFNFPRKYHFADMKEQIRNNTYMCDDTPNRFKPPGMTPYAPKTKRYPEPEECWWND